jgi:Family of unknown function (DUF5397)
MNVIVTTDRNVTVPLDAVVGSFRTFGRVGPLYEVLAVGTPATGTNVLLRIRVLESGEELDYPLGSALDGPLAP